MAAKLLARLPILIGLVCFLNAGFSMLQYRRYVSRGEGEAFITLPDDVKLEAAVGLALCIIGTVIMFTSNMKNIDMLQSYQNRTLEQIQPRRNFRNIARTRGKLHLLSERVMSLEEAIKK